MPSQLLSNPISNQPLAASQQFISPFEPVALNDLSEYLSYVVVLASSDVAGTVYVEQSIDSINVSRSDSLATAADPGPQGGQSALFKVQLILPFVRYRYVNGTTAQTRFLLWRRFSQS